MSAIWGEFSLGGEMPDNIDAIMTGPYREKCRIDRYAHTDFGPLYAGCGVQFVTPEAEREVLPIVDEERQIVFSGDCILDNRRDVIAELNRDGRAVCPEDAPDGTIMYQTYVRFGIECVKLFRGVFALAIYDGREDALYLVADQTGSRVLNWYCPATSSPSRTITYSTLIQPIRDLHPEIQVNEEYMLDYICAPQMMPTVTAEDTAYRGVRRVEPGTYLKCTKSGCEKVKYFELKKRGGEHPRRVVGKRRAEALGLEFRRLYDQCVQDALRSSRQVGIALSSGLDSSSVGALAATHLRSEGRNLYAYTYVPAIEYQPRMGCICDETEDVKQIANMHPNIITHFLNNKGENCLTQLEEILDTVEMPVKAYGNLPSLCEIYDNAYKDGCRILLTGQCGNSTVSHGLIDDVLFDLALRGHGFTWISWLCRYSKTIGESRKAAIKGCRAYFAHAREVLATKEYGLRDYVSDNPFVTREAIKHPIAQRLEASGIQYMDRIPAEGETYRRQLVMSAQYSYIGDYETKLGLKYGIVLRDPTRDVRMQEFCLNLPFEAFGYRGEPRWLIRHNLRDILPLNILDDWMRYGMQNVDLFERLVRDREQLGPIFDRLFIACPYVDSVKAREQMEEILNSGDVTREFEVDQAVFAGIMAFFMAK